ncbi:MAG: polyhydroxyalkanoate synthesis repressor PhaR [Woeseiaceae bacterium]|nr:polyhydroxyalkanoate synthesis repressor PhaR [Woeseiaceae bacterium]
MSTSRIIKKYPNRRLYDTEESRYITLSDVRRLVVDERRFVVVDKKTGADITRSVLLQVISDQEQQSASVLSEAFLVQVIRCHGQTDPQSLASQLESTLRRYLSELKGFSDHNSINPLTSGPQMP